ncbi:hypothetical protein V8G69_15515 [Gaetbulibacter sp. M235]|uniref:hypothetical protein n=1 Tax=Gaetbulibacter sp. M235 TaxID=3126510 RepID=UPI00374F36AD
MKLPKLVTFLFFLGLNSCIQDDIIADFVPEEVRIISNVNTLTVGDVLKLEASYFNKVGQKENKTIVWESSNLKVLSIDEANTISAESEGDATISAKTTGDSGELTDSKFIMVVKKGDVVMPSESIKKGTFTPTSSYESAGDFEIKKNSTGIQIELSSNYIGDDSLPGFALFLTNNPNSLVNALQIDAYDDSDGVHYKGAFIYNIEGVGLNDYKYLVQWCRPFSILVGQALIMDK